MSGNLWSDEALDFAHEKAIEAAEKADIEYKKNHPVKWIFKKIFVSLLVMIGIIFWLLYWLIVGTWPILLMVFALYMG